MRKAYQTLLMAFAAMGCVLTGILLDAHVLHLGHSSQPQYARPLGTTARLRLGGSRGSLAASDCAVEWPEGRTTYQPAFPDVRTGELPRQPTTADLAGEVVQLRKRLLDLRQAYGVFYCSVKGVGPTGGFCVPDNPTDAATAKNSHLDKNLCSGMAKVLGAGAGTKSLADFGAGQGQYGKCIMGHMPGLRYQGYDGADNTQKATGGFLEFLDLTEPVWLGTRYDWVMSLEVGEHLDKRFEQTFLDTIARHAAAGIILSWAVPGQTGWDHVNPQPNAYIVGQMEARGFTYDNTTSMALRTMAEFWWFKSTVGVFRRPEPLPATVAVA